MTTIITTLVGIECFKCHVLFGMTEQQNQICLERGHEFYCSNGHRQFYMETEVQRLKKKLQTTQNFANEQQRQKNTYRDQRDHQARRAVSLKGVVTRTKRRIAVGKCPCCHIEFKDLQKHMKKQHPGYGDE